jgi:hypothetical protein
VVVVEVVEVVEGVTSVVDGVRCGVKWWSIARDALLTSRA